MGDGSRRRAMALAGVPLLVAAAFYFVTPFSMQVEPVTPPQGIGLAASAETIRAECSAPWRQLVSPPSMHTTLGTGSRYFTTAQHNRQPLCKNTGRSRALFSGWLLFAAVVLIVCAPRRRRGRADVDKQAISVDVA